MAPPMHFKPQQSPQLHNFALPALRWATSSPSSSSQHRRLPDFKSALVSDACSADETEKTEGKKTEAEECKKKFVIRLKTKNNNVPIKAEVEDHVSMPVGEKMMESKDCVSIVDGEKDVKQEEAEEEEEVKEVKEEEEEVKEAEEEEEEEPPMKIWNLRPRNVLMKANWRHDINASRGAVMIQSSVVQEIKDPSKEEEKKKLSVSLSKNEIEKDFVAMTGSKPSRKPHKRSKSLQRKIDYLYPGKRLYSVTLDNYKVNEGEPRLKV